MGTLGMQELRMVQSVLLQYRDCRHKAHCGLCGAAGDVWRVGVALGCPRGRALAPCLKVSELWWGTACLHFLCKALYVVPFISLGQNHQTCRFLRHFLMIMWERCGQAKECTSKPCPVLWASPHHPGPRAPFQPVNYLPWPRWGCCRALREPLAHTQGGSCSSLSNLDPETSRGDTSGRMGYPGIASLGRSAAETAVPEVLGEHTKNKTQDLQHPEDLLRLSCCLVWPVQ